MKIIIDAFGGDNAPEEIVKGGVRAARELGVSIIFTGDEERIREILKDETYPPSSVEIVHAPDVIAVEDSPTKAIKEKTESSLVKAFMLLKEGRGDAMVSAGSTGAILAGAVRYVKRIKGIHRPALAPVIPTSCGVALLIDAGSNTNCRPAYLKQFAQMGSIYMKNVLGLSAPRVGLANIGAEETKGDELSKATYPLLKELTSINFIGNIEGRDIPSGAADVIVCDGFVGNMLLKFYEGVGKTFFSIIKNTFSKNLKTKLAYLLAKGELREFKKMMDYTEHGGAPFLGVDGAVIKAHGSSNAKAIYFAVRQAKTFVENNVLEEIKKEISMSEEAADD